MVENSKLKEKFIDLYYIEVVLSDYMKNYYIGSNQNAQVITLMWLMYKKLFDIIVLKAIKEVDNHGCVITNWIKYMFLKPFKAPENIPIHIVRLKDKKGVLLSREQKVIKYTLTSLKQFCKSENLKVCDYLNIPDKDINEYLELHEIEYNNLVAKKPYDEYNAFSSYIDEIDFLFDLDTLRQIRL